MAGRDDLTAGPRVRPRPPRGALLFSALLPLLGPAAERGGAQAIPFHTPTALPVALEEAAPRLLVQRVRVGSLVGSDRPAPTVTVDVGAATAPYALRRGTVVMVGVPYVRRTLERAEPAPSRASNSGLGDATILVRQELLARDFIGGNRRLAIFLGATLPTGETEARGEPLEPPLRLGRGTARLRAQAAYSHVGRRFGVHGAVGYDASTGSSFGVRPGGEVSYDAAVGARIHPDEFQTLREATLGAYLEVNGTYARPDGRGGEPVADTGGHLMADWTAGVAGRTIVGILGR